MAIMSAPAAIGAETDPTLVTEARLAARHPGRFVRSGTTLRIGGNTLTDNVIACAKDDTPCVNYRAEQVFGRYVGVLVESFEAGSYLLVGPDLGDNTEIGNRPMASPNGKRFVVVAFNEMADWTPLDGAAVWEWRANGPVRLRVVDYHLQLIEGPVAWRGNSCVEMLAWQQAGAPTPVWLAEQDGDWRLFRKRPAICKG